MATALDFNAKEVPLLFHAGNAINFLQVYKINGVAQAVAGLTPVYTISFPGCNIDPIEATIGNGRITVVSATVWRIKIPKAALVDIGAGSKGWQEFSITEHERTYYHGPVTVQSK